MGYYLLGVCTGIALTVLLVVAALGIGINAVTSELELDMGSDPRTSGGTL